MFENKLLLNTKELSEWLGLSEDAIYTKKSRGKFPKGCVVKIGSRLMFRKDAILQWIDSCEASPLV